MCKTRWVVGGALPSGADVLHVVLWEQPPPPPPGSAMARGALEGKGPQRRPQQPLDRRSEEVAKAVGGGYCRLQMPLKLALAVGDTGGTLARRASFVTRALPVDCCW